jgi:hypothetical protein
MYSDIIPTDQTGYVGIHVDRGCIGGICALLCALLLLLQLLVFVKPIEILWWIIRKRTNTGEHFTQEEGCKYRIHREKGRENGLWYKTNPWEAIEDLTTREIRKTWGCLVLILTSYVYIVLMGDCLKAHLGKGTSRESMGGVLRFLYTGGGL